jgi:hypothetical protein
VVGSIVFIVVAMVLLFFGRHLAGTVTVTICKANPSLTNLFFFDSSRRRLPSPDWALAANRSQQNSSHARVTDMPISDTGADQLFDAAAGFGPIKNLMAATDPYVQRIDGRWWMFFGAANTDAASARFTVNLLVLQASMWVCSRYVSSKLGV